MFRGICCCTLGLTTLLWLAGCTPTAKGPTLVPVKGTVNLDGKPLAEGEVMFSLPGEVPATIPVVSGAYSGQAGAGKNRVEVRAYRPGKPLVMGDKTFPVAKENYLPAKYNTQSTFTADVTAGGANDFKFDVTSK